MKSSKLGLYVKNLLFSNENNVANIKANKVLTKITLPGYF